METKDRSGKLLFTVHEVFSNTGYLNEKARNYYNIPHYQRGYKWEPNNVTKLLTDIFNFEASGNKFYCLQNITIVGCNDYFNVIDGQQRLTTLSLILSFLQQKSLVAAKIRFPDNSIRKFTNRFLSEVVTNEDSIFPESDWEEFVREYPDYDLQDIGHIYQIYRAIEDWFTEKQTKSASFDLERFKRKLLHDVRLIINEVDGHTSEEKVFGNLNSKRIPLDGSDLIRAILITRVAKEEGRKESDLKNIVYVNERRVKLGWELDQINNWWGRDDVSGYFAGFISIKSELIGEKKLFHEELYPVNMLYLLFAESDDHSKLTLDLIEQHAGGPIVLYKAILKIHYTLQDWYEDTEIYHFLGFLFNVRRRKVRFHDIWKIWERSNTRSAFVTSLKVEIRSLFEVEDELLIDFKDLGTNWYRERPEELVMTLILMDVINSVKRNHPRLPYNRFWKSTDDVEHIFPQNPREVKNKKSYIEFLNKYVQKPNKRFDLSTFDQLKDDELYLSKLNSFIEKATADMPINAIGNLVLLYRKLNQSISNSVYASKRSRILEHHSSGAFIQPHTFKVFTRNFNDDAGVNRDFEYWTKEDIRRNCEYIDREINLFLKSQVSL